MPNAFRLPLSHHSFVPASVDLDGRTGDVARLNRREESDERGEIFRRPEPAHGYFRRPLLDDRLRFGPLLLGDHLGEVSNPVRHRVSRADAVDGDIEGGQFIGERFGETDHA